MNRATNSDSGVTPTTTSAINQLFRNMKPSVTSMVSAPVNSWVKPISNPSANWSASAITRLTVSPWGWVSMYESGRTSM